MRPSGARRLYITRFKPRKGKMTVRRMRFGKPGRLFTKPSVERLFIDRLTVQKERSDLRLSIAGNASRNGKLAVRPRSLKLGALAFRHVVALDAVLHPERLLAVARIVLERLA